MSQNIRAQLVARIHNLEVDLDEAEDELARYDRDHPRPVETGPFVIREAKAWSPLLEDRDTPLLSHLIGRMTHSDDR